MSGKKGMSGYIVTGAPTNNVLGNNTKIIGVRTEI